MLNDIKVFIAGPYTKGDVAHNVARAMSAAHILMNAGLHPYVPHLSHFLHMHHWRAYDDWLQLGMVFLRQCDMLLRLDGESVGADIEVRYATKVRIPIYTSIAQLIADAATFQRD